MIASPEILEMNLVEGDNFICLASDGVWEFMPNEEVASIIYPFYLQKNAEKAAETLVRAAFKRWKQEENYSIDDITCIVIFVDIK